MAFNIIAETTKKLDFDSIHSKVFSKELGFEFIPMPALGLQGGDALSICIPIKNTNEETWKQLKPVLKKLRSEYNCDVYDLYGGQNLVFLIMRVLRRIFCESDMDMLFSSNFSQQRRKFLLKQKLINDLQPKFIPSAMLLQMQC